MFATRIPRPVRHLRVRALRAGAVALAVVLVVSACTATSESASSEEGAPDVAAVVDAADAATPVDASAASEPASNDTDSDTAAGELALWDSSTVHDIAIEFDDDDYAEMIATYESTGEKDWIEATVTIDGVTYDEVGLRLKGNSSLRSLTSESAGNPGDLPWLIRLDKYDDDQDHQGYVDIVIRSNSTETSLNEAVALELLEASGLATQQAIATTFTVNGGDTELRLALQHPDGVWEDENFDSDESALYKAESTGDFSYRGDDPDAYDEVFDQEAGDDDLDPLIDFLDFINNAEDETFATELADRLDVESFATYLAFQDLVDNFDDIDGPGNNAYLQYDYDTGLFTVVNWDLNLAFGTANVDGGPLPGDVAGGPPDRARPAGAGGFPGGGPAFGNNVLVDRFMEEFQQLYDEALVELTETLYADGTATAALAEWVDVLSTQSIVDDETIAADAEAVRQSFPTV
ncbi:MAG: CotH kinase family protein [Ilumatobacter sp.]|uniref:CotH kinase family protein n=1 Tax=Ilumatobacter sp. TaxID=1967498 RepID=UPI002617EEA4|nr:CotH kinase family protein [Ilumatobacter sp.]MDJ0767557.1 CotH kinase family protein [Ilumatobacter sp.]